jgi:hypothetical protein
MLSRSLNCSGNSIAFLQADHRELLEGFERFFALRNPSARQQAWQALSEALMRHMAVEAEVFFPAFLDATEDSLTHFVASVGHENIAAEMQDLSAEPSASVHFVSRVRTLKKVFMHHVAGMERDGGMFEVARRSTINHEMLTRLVRAHYESLEASVAEGAAPIDRWSGSQLQGS